MLLREVLVCEFLAIDGLATCALLSPEKANVSTLMVGEKTEMFLSLIWKAGFPSITRMRGREREFTYIATSEITSLKHEFGNHTMELGALVSETFLASTKGAKVFNCFRADMIVQDEVNSAFLFCSGESQHTRAFFFFLCLLFICAGLEKGGEVGAHRERE